MNQPIVYIINNNESLTDTIKSEVSNYYKVFSITASDDALSMYQHLHENIKAVLISFSMPNKDGLSIANSCGGT